jgi:predicted RNA-binding Zn ribbon-like protein
MSATTTMTSVTPREIELVRGFVNTVDHDEGTDALDSPAALERWLRGTGLAVTGMKASGRDLRLAVRLRDALRAELATHHGRKRDAKVAVALEDVCRELPLTAVCSSDALAPASGGIRGALGKIVAAAATARIKGTWGRLKICPADDCQWAFYDTSRNRSKRWCSMEVCGNRSKVRAFRGRTHP